MRMQCDIGVTVNESLACSNVGLALHETPLIVDISRQKVVIARYKCRRIGRIVPRARGLIFNALKTALSLMLIIVAAISPKDYKMRSDKQLSTESSDN